MSSQNDHSCNGSDGDVHRDSSSKKRTLPLLSLSHATTCIDMALMIMSMLCREVILITWDMNGKPMTGNGWKTVLPEVQLPKWPGGAVNVFRVDLHFSNL